MAEKNVYDLTLLNNKEIWEKEENLVDHWLDFAELVLDEESEIGIRIRTVRWRFGRRVK